MKFEEHARQPATEPASARPSRSAVAVEGNVQSHDTPFARAFSRSPRVSGQRDLIQRVRFGDNELRTYDVDDPPSRLNAEQPIYDPRKHGTGLRYLEELMEADRTSRSLAERSAKIAAVQARYRDRNGNLPAV